jgi:hypothetical protein
VHLRRLPVDVVELADDAHNGAPVLADRLEDADEQCDGEADGDQARPEAGPELARLLARREVPGQEEQVDGAGQEEQLGDQLAQECAGPGVGPADFDLSLLWDIGRCGPPIIFDLVGLGPPRPRRPRRLELVWHVPPPRGPRVGGYPRFQVAKPLEE